MFTRFSLRDYNFKLLITVIIAMICGVVMINSADSSFTPKQCVAPAAGKVIGVEIVDQTDHRYWAWRYHYDFCLSIKLRLCVPVLPCVFHH